MRVSRLSLLALIAVIASAGCRAGGLGNLNPSSPVPPPQAGLKASEVLEEHNRNAERIQSFEARPSITVAGRNRLLGRVDGKLAMARPRDFKLELKGFGMQDVADIGSNDDEFWFWVRQFEEKGERAIYFCKQEESGANPAAATFKPDWIVEALGFRIVPAEEMSEISVKPGREPGTLLLTQNASAGSGVSFTRETVLWESNHRIKELRIYSAEHRLLAQATVDGTYREIPAGPDAAGPDDKIYVPSHLKLDWFQEKLSLDVTLKDPRANKRFSDTQREALFVEPVLGKDYKRINLASLAPAASGTTTVRETRPAPAPRVRLLDPSPMGTDGAQRAPRDPVALSADLPDTGPSPEPLLAPKIPSPPDPEFVKAGASGWRSSSPRIPAVIER